MLKNQKFDFINKKYISMLVFVILFVSILIVLISYFNGLSETQIVAPSYILIIVLEIGKLLEFEEYYKNWTCILYPVSCNLYTKNDSIIKKLDKYPALSRATNYKLKAITDQYAAYEAILSNTYCIINVQNFHNLPIIHLILINGGSYSGSDSGSDSALITPIVINSLTFKFYIIKIC